MKNTDFPIFSFGEKGSKLSSIVLMLMLVILTVNLVAGYALGKNVTDGSVLGGSTFSITRAIIIPLIIVGVFQIGKKYRNVMSRAKIFLFSSLFVLISVSKGFSLL